MSDLHYTAGPWLIDEENGWIYSRPSPLTKFVIAQTESGTHEEMIANARLIDAAPDLLRLVRDFRNECSGTPRVARLIDLMSQADAAIARVEGRK